LNYQPTPIPENAGFRGWLASQLRQIADTLTAPSLNSIHFSTLNAQPAKIADGDLVRADGVNWNPGSGEGLYERRAGAWVKL